MVSPTYLNQHEDLLYRQKYLPTKHWEESHVSNAKYENFGSFRSLAISYMFSVRYYCQKKAMLLTVLQKLVTLHHRPPTRAPWEISMGEWVFITADDQIAGPYLLKTQELPGTLPPGHPAGALWRAHGPHPYIRGRALMRARRGTRMDIFRPSPLFLKIHSSKKVTQHDFDRLYLFYSGFLSIKLDIPRKPVYLSFDWYLIC